MSAHRPPRGARPPLNPETLNETALRYVGRFATSKARLRAYLQRKLRERGWEGSAPPELERIAERFSELGYVDDAAYALSKSQALASRGYGRQRLEQKLRLDGIGDDDGVAARALANAQAVDAALRFARRRRIGAFGAGFADPRDREKAIAAMVRAGHSFALARAIAEIRADEDVDEEALRERAGLRDENND